MSVLQADTDKDDTLTVEQLRQLLLKGSERFSHLREHAEFLNTMQGGVAPRWGGLVKRVAAGGA